MHTRVLLHTCTDVREEFAGISVLLQCEFWVLNPGVVVHAFTCRAISLILVPLPKKHGSCWMKEEEGDQSQRQRMQKNRY